MGIATAVTTITGPRETVEYIHLEKDEFKPPADSVKGPSPFADKHLEGPSYKLFDGDALKPSGALDSEYEFIETTPVIGREYPTAQVKDILENDELIRDLAITISRRGVVFFRNQDLTLEEQKTLVDKLGRLTGKPETSGIHIHPSTPAGGFLKKDGSGEIDPEVSFISSVKNKKLNYATRRIQLARTGIHSDIGFEAVPSDYASLKIVETPSHGGDTLWYSATALYDKLSPSFRAYLETLTGVYGGGYQKERLSESTYERYSGVRGAPENVGDFLSAVHPAVRTNPVTRWKSVYALGHQFRSFNGLTEDESKAIQDYLNDLLVGSHDIQVRFKWNKNDLAIWDNRSNFHAATLDFYSDTDYVRTGVRTVGIGERPYFDPNSRSRAEDLQTSHLTS
ncbi:Jlp1p [Sugiyamaella lignohabitans]|uniref:Jlp1p n=1 Tax=Sugiyamaella lignohabitans TaxID=796027 RepID=A0A167FHQ9_9ASCO|nr:Jlp1p [Sugiyamaella lignohabitans]ANB15314.1 Jlp1p [Sugiyamaella lignohabitans]